AQTVARRGLHQHSYQRFAGFGRESLLRGAEQAEGGGGYGERRAARLLLAGRDLARNQLARAPHWRALGAERAFAALGDWGGDHARHGALPAERRTDGPRQPVSLSRKRDEWRNDLRLQATTGPGDGGQLAQIDAPLGPGGAARGLSAWLLVERADPLAQQLDAVR